MSSADISKRYPSISLWGCCRVRRSALGVPGNGAAMHGQHSWTEIRNQKSWKFDRQRYKQGLPDLGSGRGEASIDVGASIGQPAMLEPVQPGVILMSCT